MRWWRCWLPQWRALMMAVRMQRMMVMMMMTALKPLIIPRHTAFTSQIAAMSASMPALCAACNVTTLALTPLARHRSNPPPLGSTSRASASAIETDACCASQVGGMGSDGEPDRATRLEVSTALRICYALSGTDVGCCGAARHPLSAARRWLCKTLSRYRPRLSTTHLPATLNMYVAAVSVPLRTGNAGAGV
eukprot:1242459-Rhodomonas_salina.5